MQELTTTDLVAVKTKLDEDLRRFAVSREIPFNGLCALISKLYGLESFSLKYADEESDLISITSTEELAEAFRICACLDHNPTPILRLTVFRSVGESVLALHENPSCAEKAELLSIVMPKSDWELSFKQQNSLEARQQMTSKIQALHNDSIPIIVEKQVIIGDNNFRKFLIPKDLAVTKFIKDVITLMDLPHSCANVFFVNRDKDFYALPPSKLSMKRLYKNYKDEDGFLYLIYAPPL